MSILYLTVASTDYIDGVIALYKSIKKHHPNFNYDFKVVYHPKYCPLTEEGKERLTKLYSKFIFQEVSEKEFQVINMKIKHPRFNYACLLSLFAFNQPNYDKVIFLDSDVIFVNKFDQIENLEGDFIGVIDKPIKCPFYQKIIKNKSLQVNVGLLIINKKYNNLETFNGLITIMNNKRRVKLPDQEVINDYFDGKEMVFLPLEYNRQIREFYPNEKIKEFEKNKDKEICLHFCGPKPWHGGIPKTSEMEKIWWEYFNHQL
jgi:lipopolysaccharide biosynthesis glycosyltransferase